MAHITIGHRWMLREQLIANLDCGNKQRITAKVFLMADHVVQANMLYLWGLLRGIYTPSQYRK